MGSACRTDGKKEFCLKLTEFDAICEKLGLPKGPLPHANPSTHRHYTDYYTPKLRKLVGDLYRRDVAVLDYRFSGS
ncbi:MAG: hypothetical protein ABIP48_25375 [Planctomycetota bacterium]